MSEDLGIRVGTPEDVDAIMEIALSACEENGFVDPNPAKLLGEIWPALNLDKGLIGIIGDPGDKAEGAVLLRIGSMWYSDKEVLEEKAIFIHPDYRSAKGGRARRLCQFSKQVADTLASRSLLGCCQITGRKPKSVFMNGSLASQAVRSSFIMPVQAGSGLLRSN